jgi:hypothetical protein
MRRTLVLLAGIALAIPLGATAHASANSVELRHSDMLVPAGSGFELAVLCSASSVSPDQTVVAPATAVTCTVNGSTSSRMMPGPQAYTTVITTVIAPYTVCVSGQGSFVDPRRGDLEVVATGPQCETVPI